jgi:hypothetical protein
MAMTKDYDPRRDGPKRPRPTMPSKPSAGNKPRPSMPQIIDDMPMPTIPGTNEPDYPIYLPPMPSRPVPSRPIKPGGRPLPGSSMPSFDEITLPVMPSRPGKPGPGRPMPTPKDAARQRAIMDRLK